MLSGHYRVRLARQWPDGPVDAAALQEVQEVPQMLLALHARRSAPSIAAWAEAHPDRPLVVALTGTDLYRDIHSSIAAQQALQSASRLIVLQDQGAAELPPRLRHKCRVVFQSTPARRTLPKTTQHLRAVMVGHLRDEKWPQTLFEAARLLAPEEGILIDHLGVALDPDLGELAHATAAACPHYRWLGGLPHAATRSRIQRAHVLVHTSRMEGGSHAIMEAVCSGTPVLASRISGNVGMLGVDYTGYYPPGDAHALVALLRACRRGIGGAGGPLAALQAQCALRLALFAPAAEQSALLAVMHELQARLT